MKNYLITVEHKQITTMIVNGENEEDAVNKVNDVMINCEKIDQALKKFLIKSLFLNIKRNWSKKANQRLTY